MPKTRKTLPSSDRPTPARNAGARENAPPDAASRAGGPRRRKSAPEAHDESPLKSLGKAVSAPVLGAAEEDEGEKPA